MVLFPHLAPTPNRGQTVFRRYFLIVPVVVIVGFIGFTYMGGLDVVPNYRPFNMGGYLGNAPPPPPPAESSVPPWMLPIEASPIDKHHSPYSFDINAGPDTDVFKDWMAKAPDSLSLARLSIPGTHDTMTHNVSLLGYRCQNNDLRTQLMGGVRYLDIRARVQVNDEALASNVFGLGIYHGHVYTGFSFGDVLQTVSTFLKANPSEAIILRLKEEGIPMSGSASDPPERSPDYEGPAPPSKSGSLFLDAFQHYLETDERLASHLYDFDQAKAGTVDLKKIPTMGELRGKILLLQEFPYFPQNLAYTVLPRVVPVYGILWYLESDLLAVEDKWQMRNLDDLDGKWAAVKANLEASTKQGSANQLYLSHLSASVGVTPIDAASGPMNRSTVGINDRTGEFVRSKELFESGELPIGVVMADFPGKELMRAIIERNEHVV